MEAAHSILAVGHKEQRRELLVDVAVLRVLHQSDDFNIEVFRTTTACLHPLPDRIAPEIEFFRELLVDDRHLRRAVDIRSSKLAPYNQRNSHRSEVAGTHLVIT